MSAGRLQLYDKRAVAARPQLAAAHPARPTGASCACASSARSRRRGRSCCRSGEARRRRRAVSTLGPEAWPDPPPFARAARRRRGPCTRCCATSGHRRHRALVGRRDPLDRAPLALQARRRPLRRRGGGRAPRARRRACSARRSTHYEEAVDATVPDKLPMPLQVHRRQGEPCPRCGTTARGDPLQGLRDDATARRSRRAAGCSRTAGSRGCSSNGHQHEVALDVPRPVVPRLERADERGLDGEHGVGIEVLARRSKMCVTTVRWPGARTIMWMCAGRHGWRPVAASIAPTGPSSGIVYGDRLDRHERVATVVAGEEAAAQVVLGRLRVLDGVEAVVAVLPHVELGAGDALAGVRVADHAVDPGRLAGAPARSRRGSPRSRAAARPGRRTARAPWTRSPPRAGGWRARRRASTGRACRTRG